MPPNPIRSTAEDQIVTCYEEHDMTPDQIADSLQWDIHTVRIALYKNSDKFRAEIKCQNEEDITDLEYRDIIRSYKQLAMYSEIDSVRERALKTLIGMKKGWDGYVQQGARLLNIVQINNTFKLAREESKRILDIEAEEVKNI